MEECVLSTAKRDGGLLEFGASVLSTAMRVGGLVELALITAKRVGG